LQKDNPSRVPGDEAKALREDLCRRAKFGEMTGEEADEEAERLGVGRLSGVSDPERFNPLQERNWTLPMTVVWIATRNLWDVQEWSHPHRGICRDWHWIPWQMSPDGPVYEGWHLLPRSRATLKLLIREYPADQVTVNVTLTMTVSEAKEALWRALSEGLLQAIGTDKVTGRRVAIPAEDWRELVAVEGPGERDEVRRGSHDGGFADVLLPSRILFLYWPAPKTLKAELPPTLPPTGEGYMPLMCAAQWIATKGGTFAFDPNDKAVWRGAYEELLSAAAVEAVRVIGTRDGQRYPVPGYTFAGCEVDYPFVDTPAHILKGDHFYLRTYPYEEEHWRMGFDDAIVRRHEESWTRLMVNKSDVRERWPILEGGSAPLRTGYPGRPSKAKNLIEDEFQRRSTSGCLAATLPDEAAALLQWLRAVHPSYQPPSVKTVKNNIREMYRRAFTKNSQKVTILVRSN
jgi:hypothetical protein